MPKYICLQMKICSEQPHVQGIYGNIYFYMKLIRLVLLDILHFYPIFQSLNFYQRDSAITHLKKLLDQI